MPSVISPAVPEGELGEVVGPEREELGVFGHLLGNQRRPGDLDHGADEVGYRDAHLGGDAIGHPPRLLERLLHLADGAGERNHDLGLHAYALLGRRAGRFSQR